MATELASFGIQKLWDLLSQEYEKFQGVEDQVTELKGDLNMLKSFLKDADARKQTSAVVRNCVEEIKGIVCDAEDIIETFLLKEKFRKTSDIKKHIRRLACVIPDRGKIALDIESISKRISKVIQVMQSFGVHQMIADGSHMQPLHDRQKAARQTFSKDYESDLVGLEANVKKLVGYFVNEDNVQVVSITGMAGVGKSTLARQVFNHEDVKKQFDGLAWVCVSQDFTRKNVWQKILENLTTEEEEKKILEMTETTLQGELFRLLETSKSLIVLDDIWKEEDWNLIKPIFHPSNKGCKMLLTSRNESIAVRGDTTYINFRPDCLNDGDSWTLFQRIAHPMKDAPEFKIDVEMEEMGKQMIKHCGGLPLAIKVLGGFLAAKYTWKDWKRISENVRSHIVGGAYSDEDNNSSVYHVLSMSFEELPSHLKYCFLYLSHFPEDYPISVEKLSYYWAAEGIPKPRHYNGETIRDVGEYYIEELVRRNIVISGKDVKTLRFETCHLHDMMREVCLFKAKEEKFLQISNTRSPTTSYESSCTSRRFVSQNPITLHVDEDVNNSKIRSLLIVMDYERKSMMLSGSSFGRLELLRVLDLSRARFKGGKLPSGIGKLIHLRYLSLERAEVLHLPSSLGNLMLLIYLNLDVELIYERCLFVPNFLTGMKELRYLALPRAKNWKTKLELGKLVNLETLESFSTRCSSSEDLRGMARLRILSILLMGKTSIETLVASISGLEHIENLKIDDYERQRTNEEGVLLDFLHLKQLILYVYMPRFPKEPSFPSNLTTLELNYCGLEEDPMPILEKMLHLNKLYLSHQSFSGRRMVCSSNGFPQLHKLILWELKEWEEWIVEEGSMPLLHTLYIWNCQKLKELPDGLRFIYSLKELCMDKEWVERLAVGGEDYYKVKHIPSVKFRTYE
ncbi:hypothetical protein CARUB_v10022028mg [Capsella rubella]|uniref:AAA+ ATPase domain-containing protein n=1 Tax=Capsella rubella TaxID=81985 RepID=R0GFA7_9BRAS|nr:putative disease resistance protein At1g58400 [Capsella rubella]EOA34487.1 hypothetical protein CARUB_v10022028mg [Capsella rubella]